MMITPSPVVGGPVAPTDSKQTDNASDAVTPETSTPPAPASDPLSPRLAALAQREKMMRMQAKQLQAEKAAIESARAESKAEVEKARSWQTRLPEDPWGVLSEAGLTPEQISERVFSPEALEKYKFQKFQTDLEKKMQSQIDALKSSQEQHTTQQMEQARNQFKREVSMLAKNNPEYEAIQAHGEVAEQAVVDLIEATFNQDGYVMDVDKAAQEVEEYLIQKSMELAKMKKVQSRLSPPPAEVPEAQAQQIQNPNNTLSNRNIPSTTKPLSDRERRERAILAFQGKL